MTHRVALLLALCAAGCFERGGSDSNRAEPTLEPAADIAVAPTLTGHRHRDPTGPPDPAGSLTVGLAAEPAHLNPLLGGDAVAARIAMGAIYEGLLCRGQVGEPAALCLAQSVKASPDGKVWMFRLRPGVRWHDGAAFGVNDVLFTYGLLTAAQPVPSLVVADFDDLITVSAVGADAVRFEFSGYRAQRRDAFARVPILPRHLVAEVEPAALAQAPLSRSPVGTGPLAFVGWERGARITLARFDGYWGKSAGLAQLRYELITSRQRAVTALAAGEIDLLYQVPVDQAVTAAADQRDVGLFEYDLPAYLAAVWNLRRPALAEPAVRRALGALLDRPGVARELFRGHARPISGPFLPGSASENPEVAPLAFNSHPTVEVVPELALLVPSGSRTMKRIADIWAADAAPHARLRVELAPWTEVLSRAREGRFDAVLLSFTTGRDVDLYHRLHSSQIGAENYGAVSDPVLDGYLEAVRVTPDEGRRRAIERKIHSRIDALQPYAFIVGDRRVGLARSRVGGVRVTIDGLDARSLWVAK